MPIFPLRRKTTIARRRPSRRAEHRLIGLEALESRQLLDASNGYIKIDLSQLDQTGLGGKYDIYMLGYASSSGQILQQDPSTNKISLGSPIPSNTVVNVTPGMVSGSGVTLSTSANLFVGGSVTFSNGKTSTIASIAANVIIATQNGKEAFVPVQPAGLTANANAAIQGGVVTQGKVTNTKSGTLSEVTDLPIAAGAQSGIRLTSLITGYTPPSGTPATPTADATVTNSKVSGFASLNANGAKYQYAPTVTFPANKKPISTVAFGLCTIDPTTGLVTGVTFTPTTEYPNLTAGSGYNASYSYPATFSTSPGNIYFYPTDANGFPGPTGATAAAVTSLATSGSSMSIALSQPATPPDWSSPPPIKLGGEASSALQIYSGGANTAGFATFVPMATVSVTNQKGATPTILNTSVPFDAKLLPSMTVPANSILSADYASGTPSLDATGRLTGISFSSTAFSNYADGTYSIYASANSQADSPWTTPSFTISNLLSTSAVEAYDPVYNIAGSSLAIEGVPGTSVVYAVPSYTITFAEPVPGGTTALTFSPDATGTVSGDGTFLTISTASIGGYPGLASGLAIGLSPTFSLLSGGQSESSQIESLSILGKTITVNLKTALPARFRSAEVNMALPPTGGSLPVIKWDSKVNNAVWAEQAPNAAPGSISVNGARIYFVLDTLQKGPPSFNYSVAVDSGSNETITVTQPPDALVWSGQVSPFQYVELTADALPLQGVGGDGDVYIDLSAVDGFFFPASLAATVNSKPLLMGQPWTTYVAPNSTGPNTYNAVTRKQILDAWKTFTTTPANFPGTKGELLREAYAALQVPSLAGIQNPSFAYPSPTTPIQAFDDCWTKALDALFKTGNQIDLVGDLTIGIDKKTAYYKGTQATVNGHRAIAFTEYSGGYNQATGATFWVFDPRNPPPSESNAFAMANGVNTAMAPGYQVFANAGVFNSGSIVTSVPTPNYKAGTSDWHTTNALKQLLSLERQVVTALNRGVGEFGIGTVSDGHSTNAPGPGVTSTYWNDETTWYHYAAPYAGATPQNIFSQWAHTAVIDPSTNAYFATYPLGSVGTNQDYGKPTKAWGTGGRGTGPYMNQTYGFGYDETPPEAGAANVPSKYLPITNTAGNVATPLTFQLVFGPWDVPSPSAPFVRLIDTIPPQNPPGTPTPTTVTTLSWTVSFSEPVKGVALDDFTYDIPSGTLGFEKKSVTPYSGTATSQTWTVTGDVTGTGTGVIGMSLTKVGSITDASGTPLTLPAIFTGQSYAVTTNPVGPTATIVIAGPSPTDAATVPFTLTFSQAVTGLSTADFTTVATGGVTGTSVQSVQVVPGSGNTQYTVTVNTGGGSGTLALRLASGAGLTPAPTGLPVTSAAYTIDKNDPTKAPEVQGIALAGRSPTSALSVSWTVTFTEPVKGVTAANFQLVASGLSGTPAITGVTPASTTNTATWTVTASTGLGSGTLGLNMANSTNVRDADSQAVTNVPFTGAAYTIDREAPAAQSIVRANASPTSQSVVSWTVTFSEAVSGLTKQNLRLVPTGLAGAQVTQVAPVVGSAPSASWTVTAATGSGSGTLRLDLVNATGITDAVGLTPTGIPLTGQAYQIQRGGATTVSAPISFMTTAGTTGRLAWPMRPFADADSVRLVATLSMSPAAGGTLRATSGAGVAVTPSGTPSAELQFSGTVAALNAYFRNGAGFISYKPTAGSLAARTLTLSAQGRDGLSGFATAAVLVRAAALQNPAPAVRGSALLGPAPAGQPVVITYAQLVTATGATQTTSRSIQFMLAGPASGRLEVWTGSRWSAVPAVANIPLVAPGGQIRWTPPVGAVGVRPAFSVKAWDGWRMSGVSAVSVNLTR